MVSYLLTSDQRGNGWNRPENITTVRAIRSRNRPILSPCIVQSSFTKPFIPMFHLFCQVGLDGGVAVSALNIPGECRPFGFEKYWLDKQEAADHRSLLAAFSPGMWLKKDTKRTDPDACDNYIDEASATGTLFDHQSEHASFQITSPSLSLRVVAYQMNVVFETVDVSDTSQARHCELENKKAPKNQKEAADTHLSYTRPKKTQRRRPRPYNTQINNLVT